MSESGASSQTLATQHDSNNQPTSVPYELVDLILSQSIAGVLHEAVEMSFQSHSIHHMLSTSWNFLGTLLGVSSTFRAIVLKLVALAFRIPMPCESILREAYSQFRALLFFKGAILARAVTDPPIAWSPLMRAYGYHLRARFLVREQSPTLDRVSEIYLALQLCDGMAGGLTWPLVDALNSQLQEVLAAPQQQ
ncbi:hypothetical protein K438DRAFT_1970589 [Mycena galopus ATCC 62051]|nr:hypothetical protein K438DRAFT_1970589 [Mycena galopus ATCC 62051]